MQVVCALRDAAAFLLLGALTCTGTAQTDGIVQAAAATVRYVPANPSTVPLQAQEWQRQAQRIIDVVGGAAAHRADAADIYYEASRAGLEPDLIFAVVEVLSRFDAWALGPQGNVGLLQLSPELHTRLGSPENTLQQAKYNLRLGCTYLRQLLDREGGRTRSALIRFLTGVAIQDQPEKRAEEIFATLAIRRSTLGESPK